MPECVNPAFPQKLFALLHLESTHCICWLDHGLAFKVVDSDRFAEEIVPKYFRHSKLTSFQRQLNLYGFRRITKGDDSGAYFHPKFQRERQDLVSEIKRLPGKGALVGMNSSFDFSREDVFKLCAIASEGSDSSASEQNKQTPFISCGNFMLNDIKYGARARPAFLESERPLKVPRLVLGCGADGSEAFKYQPTNVHGNDAADPCLFNRNVSGFATVHSLQERSNFIPFKDQAVDKQFTDFGNFYQKNEISQNNFQSSGMNLYRITTTVTVVPCVVDGAEISPVTGSGSQQYTQTNYVQSDNFARLLASSGFPPNALKATPSMPIVCDDTLMDPNIFDNSTMECLESFSDNCL